MSVAMRRVEQRVRRHGAMLEPAERRTLERSGWRTTLDYRENHVRALDGSLQRIEQVWVAEAERYDGEVLVAAASGATADEAWRNLVEAIDEQRFTTLRRVRVRS